MQDGLSQMVFSFAGQDLINSPRLQRMAVIPIIIHPAITGKMKMTYLAFIIFSVSRPAVILLEINRYCYQKNNPAST